MTIQPHNHVIIMADIIDSSAQKGDVLMGAFKNEVEKVNTSFQAGIISPLTITLGDEFQGITTDLKSAVEIILYLDQQLLNCDPTFSLRYVINIGLVDTPVNPENAYEMLGPGLTQARKLLGNIKKTQFEVLIEGIDSHLSTNLKLAFELYRSLYNSWSVEDRKVAYLFFELNDYRLVAEKYGRDPSSMWRREKSLKIREFNVARELIRRIANG